LGKGGLEEKGKRRLQSIWEIYRVQVPKEKSDEFIKRFKNGLR